jgi:hypothetical protein
MASSSRDRISVDLRGLKAALIEHARVLGVSPSDFVRAVLADVLKGRAAPSLMRATHQRDCEPSGRRVRLSMRLSRDDVRMIHLAADRAGLPVGAYVAGLAAGIPALTSAATPAGPLAALIASNATMASLGRNLHHLTSLLRQGSVRAAQEYREVLDDVAGDVCRHIEIASAVLADLRPLHTPARREFDSDSSTRRSAP